MHDASKFQKLKLCEAALIFLAYKRHRVKPQTIVMYEMYFRYLNAYFGEKYLYEIAISDIQEYQHLRLNGTIRPQCPKREQDKRGRQPTYRAGSSLINHEVNALSQIMNKADQWDRLREWYAPVEQQAPSRPRTMTRAAQDEFFLKAASNPDWEVAYLVSGLTNNTSASGIELRSLKLMDIDLQSHPPRFQVPKGKNKFREYRVIPLNETAYAHMSRVVERAMALGAYQPDHYVFPFRVKRNCYDVTRHATKSWLRKQWKALTIAAGIPWLRPHNLRFQCATRMRAAGVPAETIRNEFGWKNIKMLDLYDQPQIDILYEAVLRIDPLAKLAPERVEMLPQWMPKAGYSQKTHNTQ